jgi:tetratricopeptide (TPR) repeat protein
VDDSRSVHRRVRDAALASTGEERRRRLHGLAFDHLAHGAPLEVRALHAAEAGRSFHGLILLDELATARAVAGDRDGAVAALRSALDLARRELAQGQLDEPLAAVAVFARKLADALCDAEQFSDAEAVLREALDIAEPKSADRAQVLATLARVAHARQNRREASQYIDQAIRIARQSDSRELVASLETLKRRIA